MVLDGFTIMVCCHLIQLVLMLQRMQPKAFTTICCNGIRVFVFGIISNKWALQCVMHYSTRGEHITFHINNIGHIAIGCKKVLYSLYVLVFPA